MRHFLARNMERTLSQQPLIPVGVLLKPLVKQATLYGYNNCDFDFFLTLAKHERLGLRHALLMLQFLGKVCLNDALHGRVSTVPFLVLVGRFHDSDVLHDFLEIFVEQALATLLNLHSQKAGDAASIRSTLCIELVAKLLHLPHPKLLKRIGPVVLQAHQQYVSLRHSEHPGLAALLHFADKNRNNPTLLLPATSPRHPKKSPRDVIESYADGYAAGPDSARRGNDAGGEIELDVRQEALAPPPMRRGTTPPRSGTPPGRGGYAANNGGRSTPPRATTPPGRGGGQKPFMKKAGGADKKGAGGAYGRGGGKAAAPAPAARRPGRATTPPRSTTPPGRKGPRPGKINAKMAAAEDDDSGLYTRSPRKRHLRDKLDEGQLLSDTEMGRLEAAADGATGGGPTTRSPRKRPLGDKLENGELLSDTEMGRLEAAAAGQGKGGGYAARQAREKKGGGGGRARSTTPPGRARTPPGRPGRARRRRRSGGSRRTATRRRRRRLGRRRRQRWRRRRRRGWRLSGRRAGGR